MEKAAHEGRLNLVLSCHDSWSVDRILFVFFKKRVKSFVKGAFEGYFVTKPNADREFKNLCVHRGAMAII